MPTKKAEPMIGRHIIDGKTVYLPVGSVLEPPTPKDMTATKQQPGWKPS